MPEFDRRPPRRPNSRQAEGGRRIIVRRKENIAVGILRGLFPWKGDGAGDIIRKIIFIGSLVLMIWAVFQIVDFHVFKDRRNQADHERLLRDWRNYSGPDIVHMYLPPDGDRPEEDGRSVEVIGKYYEFYQKNNDFVGFVEIFPIIQYPVYQSDDNWFYLHHNHDRVPTTNGTVFADWEGKFTPTERPHNIVLYGHNLRTNSLFQPLVYYRPGAHGVDPFEFLKTNPVIRFDTLYERGHYKIFAVFQTNVRAHQGEVFIVGDYIYFDNKSHFDNFVAEMLDRSLFYTNVDIRYGDELLMLSTCDFSIFANGADSSVRLIVAARRVRDDEYFKFSQEELDAFIDNRGTDENGFLKRKMFDAYYNLRGTQWGGRNWDLNYIKDFAG